MKDFLKFHAAKNGKTAPFELPRIVAAGVFDGVHPGHREIIRKAAERAAEVHAVVLALSFTPHPRQLLCPGNPPRLLISENERIGKLYDAGAQETAFIDFTPEVAALAPGDFLEELAGNGHFKVAGICVGEHWRFGKCGSGDGQVLANFCRELGWTYDGVPELEYDGEIVSSTAIRNAALTGDLEKFRRLAGDDLTLTGVVEHGFAIAGTKLSAPTANLQCRYGVVPPDGVYAGSAGVDGQNYPAAVNIGFAPTFNGLQRRIEVHLIGYSGVLYDRELTVKLYRFIRPERRFDSPDELKIQIASDIKDVTEQFDLCSGERMVYK
ncbi:MAG: adenylyltransferase/cytidyltransferase family protein [Lentisphaeria bacterium]|nr:adenylyltransferase/cytidyltransferase family protein [Lentisphaeria bacterium]